MKSLMLLWMVVAEDFGDRCRVCTTRDYELVARRVEDEGLSFLTITLPEVAKDLERALSRSSSGHDLFSAFSKRGRLPRFLGGFFDLIFDRKSGLLLDNPSVEAIAAIRQLTLMFGKISLPCTPERERKAFADFVECEKEVRKSDMSTQSSGKLDAFAAMSNLLFGDVLRRMDQLVANGEIIPKHGPGSTADRLLGNKKYTLSTWTRRLDSVFPCSDYLIPNARYYQYLDRVDLLEPGAEQPVRVISVPKTLKTPRIIAIEPTAMQYVQQGLMEQLVPLLESDKLIRMMIGFTDQEPNQLMAKKGSLDGSLATLDLKEASDRVSNQLVRRLIQPYRDINIDIHEAVDACRSRSADVPNYGVLRLAKFASMGSALCFPFEAMVFLTIIFLGIQKELSRPLTKKDVASFRGQVRVYGDDIIVPTHYARTVVEELEAFGLLVNSRKSFWTGSFRESCGKEYYDGEDVSVVRVRSLFPSSTADAQESISLASLRNRFYLAGLWKTARYLDSVCKSHFRWFPTIHPNSPVLGRISLLGYETQRTHRDYHAPLVKGYKVVSKSPTNHVDDYAALLKVFLKRGSEPFEDEDHLRRSGRPDAVYIKLGYWSPF